MKDLAKLIIFVLLISVGLIFVFRHETPNDALNMATQDPASQSLNLITPAPPEHSGDGTLGPIMTGPGDGTSGTYTVVTPLAPPMPQPTIVAPLPPQPPQPPQDVIYTVQAKDNLYKIAEKTLGNKAEWKRIFDYNRDVISKPNSLRQGMKLRIPQNNNTDEPKLGNSADSKIGTDMDSKSTPFIDSPSMTDSQKMKTYEVVKGDTLAKIAKKLFKDSTKKKLIMKANPGLTDASLRYGTKIKVPNE